VSRSIFVRSNRMATSLLEMIYDLERTSQRKRSVCSIIWNRAFSFPALDGTSPKPPYRFYFVLVIMGRGEETCKDGRVYFKNRGCTIQRGLGRGAMILPSHF